MCKIHKRDWWAQLGRVTGASKKKKKKKKEDSRSFNFTFHYIDDVLSLNNSRVGDFAEHIYPIELEIKDTTNTDRSASYLDLHLNSDSEGQLRTKLYHKRHDINFPIVNFPFNYIQVDTYINIPAVPGYIYLSWFDIPELVVPIRISANEPRVPIG